MKWNYKQLSWKENSMNYKFCSVRMEQFSKEIHFFKEFKRIHDKITCLDKIFEMRFNFWYFYKSFWLTKNSEISNPLKNYRIWNSFFGDAHLNSRRYCSQLIRVQHSQLQVTNVFTTDIDISFFSLALPDVFSVRIFFLADVNHGNFVNHGCFDDAKKKSLDNDCHHQKGGECEYMNTWFWWCQKRIKQGCFNG